MMGACESIYKVFRSASVTVDIQMQIKLLKKSIKLRFTQRQVV